MGNEHSKNPNQSYYDTLKKLQKNVCQAGVYEFNEFGRYLLEGRNSLTVALIGKTGAGKSRLVNALIGKFKAKEGDTLIPETNKVAAFKTEKHGVEITVWDTPGVQDGSEHEDEYLKQISENVKKVDLLLYCIPMNERRIRPDDKQALEKVVNKLGTEIWKKAMIVLTFANEVKPKSTDKDSPKKCFEKRLNMFAEEYQKHLESLGVKFDVPFTPAGDIKLQELPACKDWLPVFWLMAFKTVENSAKPAMLKANCERIKLPSMQENNDTEEDEFIVRHNEEQEKTLWEIVGRLVFRETIQGFKGGACFMGIDAPFGAVAGFFNGAILGLHKYCADKKLRSGVEKEQEASKVSTQSEAESKVKPKLKPKPKFVYQPDPEAQSQTDVAPDLSQLQVTASTKVAPPTKVALPAKVPPLTKPKPKVKPKPDLSHRSKHKPNKESSKFFADR